MQKANLHSTMDRFKLLVTSLDYLQYIPLHSTMDRFKWNLFCLPLHIITFYIPLWIDLNRYLVLITKWKKLNLHSTMDRFKFKNYNGYGIHLYDLHSTMDRFKFKTNQKFIAILEIYIPLWIDLNCCPPFWYYYSIQIYIPLWIDLNFTVFICLCCARFIYIPLWIDLNANARSSELLENVFTFHYG